MGMNKLIKQVKTGGSLGCSDHALTEFVVLGNMDLAKSKVRTLNFERPNFQLFKDLVDRIPWNTVLGDRRAGQSWRLFKDAFPFLRVQELYAWEDHRADPPGCHVKALAGQGDDLINGQHGFPTNWQILSDQSGGLLWWSNCIS